VPLSKRLFTPWIIPKDVWTRFGISNERIITYRAIDPVVWIRGFRPNERVLKELNLKKDNPIVTVRPEETYAAYMLQENVGQRSVTEDVVQNLLKFGKDLQIVIVGRYDKEFVNKWRRFGRQVRVTKSIIDGPSLVAHSSLFIGAGGTMTAEAALLGVPTVSIYPGQPTFIEEYLIKIGLIHRSLNPRRLTSASIKMMSDVNFLRKHRAMSKRFLRSMEDPIAKIVSSLERLER